MRSSLLALILAALVVPTSGCDDDPAPDEGGCSLDARTSLLLTIVDAETGEPPEADLTVTYLVDGEEPNWPPAEKWPDGRYQLGLEHEGTFEVTVSAEGYETVTQEYEVTSDECHVMTLEATLELTPSA
jgi:hypothetical protein